MIERKRYEYKLVGTSEIGRIMGDLKIASHDVTKKIGTAEVFNYLGKEGWELKCKTDGANFVFVRELLEE